MKLGFITNSFVWAGMDDLDEIVKWGIDNGFQDIEIGPNIDLDEDIINEIKSDSQIDVSALIYCRNFLDSDESVASEHQKGLIDRIELAGKTGIEKIVCSTGVDASSYYGSRFDPEKSMPRVTAWLSKAVDLAEKNNVKLCIENCPMMGNIGISPYMLNMIFDAVQSDKLGLAFDPSHMVWQFMNPYEAIKEFKDKIYHVHGKDTEILYKKLERVGILHNITEETTMTDVQWWRHRLPGLGDLDWNKIVANLYEIGYDGTISIEHEDPVFTGELDKIRSGVLRSKNHINQYI